jgi:hypothetical protein
MRRADSDPTAARVSPRATRASPSADGARRAGCPGGKVVKRSTVVETRVLVPCGVHLPSGESSSSVVCGEFTSHDTVRHYEMVIDYLCTRLYQSIHAAGAPGAPPHHASRMENRMRDGAVLAAAPPPAVLLLAPFCSFHRFI